jgi:deoxycytidylate deaminase
MSDKKHIVKATTMDKHGRIIATSLNSYEKSHPIMAKLGKEVGLPEKIKLHAEVAAIIKSKLRKIHSIKIERYDTKGNPKLAKPCKICERMIANYGIKFVSYTIG